MKRALLVALSAIGLSLSLCCGRVMEGANDGAVDGGVEGAAAVCRAGAFQPPKPIAELNTPDDERGIRLTLDELTATFSRRTLEDGGARPSTINVMARASRGSPFDVSEGVALNQTTSPAVYPSLTSDGMSLFYESQCYFGDPLYGSPLCVATRDSSAVPFVGPSLVIAAGYSWPEPGAFGAGTEIGDGYTTSDAGAYYFVAHFVDGGLARFAPADAALPNGIFVSDRNASRGTPEFGSERASYLPDSGAHQVDNPVPSLDELILFMSGTDADGVPHVFVAVRQSANEMFGTPTPVHELDSPGGEYPSWLSPDGCRLYFTRLVEGQWDLYWAERPSTETDL